MPDFPDNPRRQFLKFATLVPFGIKSTLDNFLVEPRFTEIFPVQVHLLDPTSMDVEDAGTRLIRNEAVEFQEAINKAAQAVGVFPEVIGMSESIGPFRGTRYSKVQILGGVQVDMLSGTPLAPAIVDAILDRKNMKTTLVMPGQSASLYPINEVRFETENSIPRVVYTGKTDTFVEGDVHDVLVNGVSKLRFSRIAINGNLVADAELLEAGKLLSPTVVAPGTPMAKAFEKWIRTPWMSLWTPDLSLEGQVEKSSTRKIFSIGKVQNLLNSGTADIQTESMAVVGGTKVIPLNFDSDVEIISFLAAVEQKIKAQSSGLSDVKLVLYESGSLPSGSTRINLVSENNLGAIPREEPQPTADLVDMTPIIDKDTGNVVWYDKKNTAQFASIIKKPGVLYRVVSSTSGAKANEITVRPVTGKELKTVPMVSLVPSEAAIANFAPKTFAESVQGKIPDRLLQASLKDATKNTTLQEALKKLGITSVEPPLRIWQNSRLSLGAPAFGFIASVFNVLGLGEKIITLPKELMPSATTPITAKIVFVSPVNDPEKPFPVVAGFSYRNSKEEVVFGSPDIYRRVGNKLAPDEAHKVGNLQLYELDLTVGMDEVTLANGKNVKEVPAGPNRDYFASVGNALKKYFGVLDLEEAAKIVQPSGPGTAEDKLALFDAAMKNPVKLAWRLSYRA